MKEPICTRCGEELELVRPGKHQCNWCEFQRIIVLRILEIINEPITKKEATATICKEFNIETI